MPRISDAFLSCVVYFYQSRPQAEGGVNYGAAGFLVGVPERTPEPLISDDAILRHGSAYGSAGHFPHHLYIATNRHVSATCPFVRLNRRDGATTVVEPGQWHYHETSDLAVAPLEWSLTWNRDFGLAVVPISMFLSPVDFRGLDVGPGDDTFTVGRFVGHDGRESNMPVVRFGNIAMIPQQPLVIDKQGPQNVFLIESRTLPGYSGSPLFLNIPPWELRDSGKNSLRHSLGQNLGGPTDRFDIRYYTRLLGVVTGFLCNSENENTGMMAAVPSWELLELLNYPKVREQRSAEREKWKKDRDDNPPALPA